MPTYRFKSELCSAVLDIEAESKENALRAVKAVPSSGGWIFDREV